MNTEALTNQLAALIASHDKQHSDCSPRLEGTCEAITLLARHENLSDQQRKILAASIVKAFAQYNQTEDIKLGKGSLASWPINRFALETLKALRIEKPEVAKN